MMYWRDEERYIKSLKKSKGIIPVEDPELKHNALLERIINNCFAVFNNQMQNLKLVYLYSKREQPPPINDYYGVCFGTKSGIYAIGISLEAIAEGEKSATGVFLHELAHVITGNVGHTKEFYSKLQELTEHYNQKMGKKIIAI